MSGVQPSLNYKHKVQNKQRQQHISEIEAN